MPEWVVGSTGDQGYMEDRSYDCVVVGAGVAGLAAGRALAEAGQRVLVLEAQGRVGGRLLTVHVQGEETPIELGAEFVHGQPPQLVALLEEAGLASYETGGQDWQYVGGELREAAGDDDSPFALLEELSEEAPDQTFDKFLAERQPAEGVARRARRYVEGFNAADAGRIGTRGLARQQAAEDGIEGDRAWRLQGGYAGVAEYLRDRAVAAGATVLLETPVQEIAWQRGEVAVSAGMRRFKARRVIVTVPLGVLQSGRLRLTPTPEEAMEAAQSLAAGAVQRIVLQFRDQFWEEKAPGMRFLFTDGESPSTWWTSSPRASTLLVGWMGGPRAAAADLATLQAGALRSLERIFALPAGTLESELVSFHQHDWQSDAFALGAYSYAPAGAGEAAATLARPVEGTVYFAGEHTDTTGHPGTVHGALGSGLRAAAQVLADC